MDIQQRFEESGNPMFNDNALKLGVLAPTAQMRVPLLLLKARLSQRSSTT